MTQTNQQPDHHQGNPERTELDQESRLDKDLEETFPASDAPATSGVTKIGTDGTEKGATREEVGEEKPTKP